MYECAGDLNGKHWPSLFLLASSVSHYALSACNISANQRLTMTDSRSHVLK